jgi:hypothetical protein
VLLTQPTDRHDHRSYAYSSPSFSPGRPGSSSCAPKPRRSWPATSSQPACSTAPGLRSDRDRARDPADPHPRSHAASNRRMDHAAGSQPPHGPRLSGELGQVHDPRPRLLLPRRIDAVLADAGIRTVLCNVQTPRMNAIAQRWIGGCRCELLDGTLIWNQGHLRQILRDYENHCNQHRPVTSRGRDEMTMPRSSLRIRCTQSMVVLALPAGSTVKTWPYLFLK